MQPIIDKVKKWCYNFEWKSTYTYILVVILGLGVILTIALVPPSFSYVEWNQWALKRNSVTNNVDYSRVYGKYVQVYRSLLTSLLWPIRVGYHVRTNCIRSHSDHGGFCGRLGHHHLHGGWFGAANLSVLPICGD